MDLSEAGKTDSWGGYRECLCDTDFNACGSRKLPHVVVAGFFAVETSFGTITFIFDLGKREVDFRVNTSDIEASDIYW